MRRLKGKVTSENSGTRFPRAKRLKEEGAQVAIAALSPRTLGDEYLIKTLCFLDNGLKGRELEDFCEHLASCTDCRFHLEAERATSQTLHRFRPLYSAPTALRARLLALVRAQKP